MENRIIKFRCWASCDEGMKMQCMSDVMLFDNGIGFDAIDHICDWEGGVVMQFTGLLDKGGKEIYEGDILKIESEKLTIVMWSKKFASFVLNREGWMFSHWFGESCDPERCEVVGNIYDNPELIAQPK